jgi:hypothetical protein
MTPTQLESALARENVAAVKLFKSESDCAQQFCHYMRDAYMEDDRLVCEWLAFFSGWNFAMLRVNENKHCEALHAKDVSRHRNRHG